MFLESKIAARSQRLKAIFEDFVRQDSHIFTPMELEAYDLVASALATTLNSSSLEARNEAWLVVTRVAASVSEYMERDIAYAKARQTEVEAQQAQAIAKSEPQEHLENIEDFRLPRIEPEGILAHYEEPINSDGHLQQQRNAETIHHASYYDRQG